MTTILLWISIFMLLIIMILIIMVLIKLRNPVQMEYVKESLAIFGNNLDKTNGSLRDEFQRSREESSKVAKDNRDELQKSLETFDISLSRNIREFNENQRLNFESSMTRAREQAQNIEAKLEKMRETIEGKLKEIQTDNSVKLEQVYKGLGDMQKLAVGVGDLKRVLSNVKTRGTMGEIQLGSILEQYLSPEQFLKNVVIKPGTKESVEFAIKLPGNENPEEPGRGP